ncbi:hypothetical protein D9M71_62730 [compost metagenome]
MDLTHAIHSIPAVDPSLDTLLPLRTACCCEQCGGPIDPASIQLDPGAPVCIDCQAGQQLQRSQAYDPR